jgi:hypothetical protein
LSALLANIEQNIKGLPGTMASCIIYVGKRLITLTAGVNVIFLLLFFTDNGTK